jgi:hypothetical protein
MMHALTMQPSSEISLLYPACPSCGRALRGPFQLRMGSQNSRPSAAANAASGSRNQSTSIPCGIRPKARSGYFNPGFLPTSPTPSALASLALGVFFYTRLCPQQHSDLYQKIFALIALPRPPFC